jgi:hypothetical protein
MTLRKTAKPKQNLILFGVCYPKKEIDDDSGQQGDRQHRWPVTVIESALTTPSDTARAPVEGDECIYHGRHGDNGKEAGGDASDPIAKVEQANG